MGQDVLFFHFLIDEQIQSAALGLKGELYFPPTSTVNRFRPLLRLLDITSRPSLVAILARKP